MFDAIYVSELISKIQAKQSKQHNARPITDHLEAFWMRYVDDASFVQIASEFDVTVTRARDMCEKGHRLFLQAASI
jgi:hypothetical protein